MNGNKRSDHAPPHVSVVHDESLRRGSEEPATSGGTSSQLMQQHDTNSGAARCTAVIREVDLTLLVAGSDRS